MSFEEDNITAVFEKPVRRKILKSRVKQPSNLDRAK